MRSVHCHNRDKVDAVLKSESLDLSSLEHNTKSTFWTGVYAKPLQFITYSGAERGGVMVMCEIMHPTRLSDGPPSLPPTFCRSNIIK